MNITLTEDQKNRIIQQFGAALVDFGLIEFTRAAEALSANRLLLPTATAPTAQPEVPTTNGNGHKKPHWLSQLTPRQRAAHFRKMQKARWAR